ncbi:hypothetical protein KCU98_g6567, partial [Aureobasidium melanogenum]
MSWPNMLFFEAGTEWGAAARLLPTMAGLRELKLDLVPSDTNHKTFQAVGALTELKGLHLALAYEAERILSREEMLAIGQLHNLRNLTILGSELTLDEAVTDDDLVIFLSSFSEVEDVHIDAFNTTLVPSSATIALATTSTRLQHYTYTAIWDISFGESSTPLLFPELQSMRSEARLQKIAELTECFLER